MRITDIIYVLIILFDITNSSLFLNCLWLFLIYQTTVKPIQDIIIYSIIFSTSIVIWSFSVLDIKSPPCSSFETHFVDFWLLCIIFIVSEFIDTETFPHLWLQIASGFYPNRTYIFASPVGLRKFVVRGLVFVIAPVSINTLIFLQAVTQFIRVWICVGKCCPKGLKYPLG